MKKVIIGVLAAGVVVVIAVLAIGFYSLDSIVKKGVETIGPELTKVEIKLDAVHLSIFSGQGELKKLFVGNPQPYKTASAIQVGSVKLAIDTKTVTSGTIVINELTVQAPEITMEGGISGDNNLSKILANLNESMGAGGKAKTETSTPGSSKKFIVKNLNIDDGKVNLSLNIPLIAGKTATATLPGIHLKDIGTAENGVTAAELANKIMAPVINGSLQAAATYVGELTKLGGKSLDDAKKLGGQSVDEAKKAIGGLGDLLKKKP